MRGAQLQFRLQHTGKWSAGAHPPRRLCYRPAVFFRQLLVALSLSQGKIRARCSKILLLQRLLLKKKKKDCAILKFRNLGLNLGGSVFRRISKTCCCSVYGLIKWQTATDGQGSRLFFWLFGPDAPTVVEGCVVRMEATCACHVYHAWLRLLLKWQVLNLNTSIVWSGARLGGLSVHRFHVLTVQHVTWFSPYL